MIKVYADTCVYRDFLESRRDRYRDLAQCAQNFFAQVEDSTFVLVYSKLVIDEFSKYHPKEKILEFLDQFENKEEVLINYEDRKKSYAYQNKADALHAIIAIKSNAKFLTTRNIKDFEGFEEKIEIILPESL